MSREAAALVIAGFKTYAEGVADGVFEFKSATTSLDALKVVLKTSAESHAGLVAESKLSRAVAARLNSDFKMCREAAAHDDFKSELSRETASLDVLKSKPWPSRLPRIDLFHKSSGWREYSDAFDFDIWRPEALR